MKKLLATAEIGLIILMALAPLFGNLPYRINIFLSYEGAYRLYDGQIPYRDFGMPVGYMYWVIPAIFFKIFGPYMASLIKAQVFINIMSGLAFRSILKSLSVTEGISFLSIVVFLISYSFMNFWPWYNHTVIFYELVGLAFLLKFIFGGEMPRRYGWLIGSAMFFFFSFFTKQDGGAMGILIAMAMLAASAYVEKSWKQLFVFAASLIAIGLIIILPLTKYKFGYWFNHGQPPHTARVSFNDMAEDFFTVNSQWIKFYVFVIMMLLLARIKTVTVKEWLNNKHSIVFTLLTLGILVEAAIFQTTSYVPADNNIFFHSFAIAFILTLLAPFLPLNFSSWKTLAVLLAGLLLWWSQVYWKYVISKVILRPDPPIANTDGIVNKKTYLRFPEDTSFVPLHLWRSMPNMRGFKGVLLPGSTIDGIERLQKMDVVKNAKNRKILNMTELTPLAYEWKYELEKNPEYPLWYHLGVGMFQKENNFFTNRIKDSYYDLVLFEHIPYLNNFYPWQVRDTLIKYYNRVDVFTAPRNPSMQAWVEVYVKKGDSTPPALR